MKLVLLANLALVIVVVNIIQADGATWRELPTTKKRMGVEVTYCRYRGFKLLPGSTINDLKRCVTCSCSETLMDCADLGGTFSTSEESLCEPVKIFCETVWVLKKNNKRKCPDNLMPTMISGVGK